MLIFIDQTKNIKLIRVSTDKSGVVSRSRLGVISKNKLEIADDLRTQLSPEEIDEADRVIKTYQSIDDIQQDLDISRFPQIARKAVEYISASYADDLQKRLIISSLVESLRVIRKLEQEDIRMSEPMSLTS